MKCGINGRAATCKPHLSMCVLSFDCRGVTPTNKHERNKTASFSRSLLNSDGVTRTAVKFGAGFDFRALQFLWRVFYFHRMQQHLEQLSDLVSNSLSKDPLLFWLNCAPLRPELVRTRSHEFSICLMMLHY